MLQSWPRMLLALPALAALVCGMLSGLARLGFALPAPVGHLAGVHGALMVGGFLGTLIGLERAVALGRRWAYLAPALSGLAALAMIANAPNTLAPLLMSVAALFMLFACTSVWLRQRAVHHAVLGIAALAWLLGDLVWAWQGSVSPAVLFWAAFLTLTIAGERLELSRFVPTSKNAKGIICIIVTVMMDGAIYSLFNATAGSRTFALALLALALWLLRYDIARRTIRMHGLTRYMAICLLSGYAWTAVAALLGLTGAFATGHPLHDAALHALLLGFVFSMVFAHAPVILPAVSKLKVRWHAGFYAPLLSLHVTLLLRVLAALTGSFYLRQDAALGNAATIALFLLTVFTGMIVACKPRREISARTHSSSNVEPHREAHRNA